MSQLVIARHSAQFSRPTHAAFAAFKVVKARLAAWSLRRRERAQLLSLGDADLKDLGITRAQASFEYSKPFWQD